MLSTVSIMLWFLLSHGLIGDPIDLSTENSSFLWITFSPSSSTLSTGRVTGFYSFFLPREEGHDG